jgi:hypothetical protein
MYLQNKYTKWYLSIISNAKSRTYLEGYSELHHIIPKSLGGSNDPTNLVRLSAREHFICHMLLPKMVEGDSKRKMIYAWWAMANQKRPDQDRYKINSRLYNIVKSYASKNHSKFKHTEDHKKKISKLHTGKIVSDETRKKMSDNAKKRSSDHYTKIQETRKNNGYVASAETGKKISLALTGKKRILTDEHKANIKLAARNRSKKSIKGK